MAADFPFQFDFPLRAFNTFAIEAKAKRYLAVDSLPVLQRVKEDGVLADEPFLILGGGSNILLTRDFPGTVLHVQLPGISIVGEDAQATYVRAAAGESWHGLVQWTLARGLGGLENLSLIPGSVGAAPIQNIGAYGAELKDCLHCLTYFDLQSGKVETLDRAGCGFGYRDSAFKHRLRDRAIVLDITLALPKAWQPNVRYADVAQELTRLGIADPAPADIGDAVVAIRRRKLPDPAVIGNAGSFFKNPVVAAALRDDLLTRFPQLVSYPQADGSYKLAAGWLIEQCGWKGRQVGAAGVYERQALVLVNHGGASGRELAELAQRIVADVRERFGVRLEPEPVFI
jgi:UDP-N-acetylmuramate dehydrogenase